MTDLVRLPPLAPQLRVGSKPVPDGFAGTVCGGLPLKPDGALWTSTYTGDTGSEWVQWCLDNEFAGPLFKCWRLTVRPDARVYVIDTYEDLERLVKAHPPHERYRSLSAFFRAPDWESVAKRYDGVHLTERGQWATRLSHPLNLYTWDCESTAWFRWVFDEVEGLGTRTFAQIVDAEAVS